MKIEIRVEDGGFVDTVTVTSNRDDVSHTELASLSVDSLYRLIKKPSPTTPSQ